MAYAADFWVSLAVDSSLNACFRLAPVTFDSTPSKSGVIRFSLFIWIIRFHTGSNFFQPLVYVWGQSTISDKVSFATFGAAHLDGRMLRFVPKRREERRGDLVHVKGCGRDAPVLCVGAGSIPFCPTNRVRTG